MFLLISTLAFCCQRLYEKLEYLYLKDLTALCLLSKLNVGVMFITVKYVLIHPNYLEMFGNLHPHYRPSAYP